MAAGSSHLCGSLTINNAGLCGSAAPSFLTGSRSGAEAVLATGLEESLIRDLAADPAGADREPEEMLWRLPAPVLVSSITSSVRPSFPKRQSIVAAPFCLDKYKGKSREKRAPGHREGDRGELCALASQHLRLREASLGPCGGRCSPRFSWPRCCSSAAGPRTLGCRTQQSKEVLQRGQKGTIESSFVTGPVSAPVGSPAALLE
ncbi:TPA: hypothetical protein BOS_9659 [Bos taurus]|nr:TPA: hypothetical protein BOS_9659 [Bos taurus]